MCFVCSAHTPRHRRLAPLFSCRSLRLDRARRHETRRHQATATDNNQVGAARRAMTATFGRKRFLPSCENAVDPFHRFYVRAGRKSPGSEAESASLSRQGPGARAGVGVTPALAPPGQLATATVIVRRRPNPLSGRQPNGAYSRADASTHALLFFFSLRGGFLPRVCAALFFAALPPTSQVPLQAVRPRPRPKALVARPRPSPPTFFQGNRHCAPFNPARAAFCVCGVFTKGRGGRPQIWGRLYRAAWNATQTTLSSQIWGGGGWAFC